MICTSCGEHSYSRIYCGKCHAEWEKLHPGRDPHHGSFIDSTLISLLVKAKEKAWKPEIYQCENCKHVQKREDAKDVIRIEQLEQIIAEMVK